MLIYCHLDWNKLKWNLIQNTNIFFRRSAIEHLNHKTSAILFMLQIVSLVVVRCIVYHTGPRFNIKMTSYQYRKSHCGDKTILRPSYLRNGISYADKTTSLYWIGALYVLMGCMGGRLDQEPFTLSEPQFCFLYAYVWWFKVGHWYQTNGNDFIVTRMLHIGVKYVTSELQTFLMT